jgi:hypothetical protein
MKADALVCKLKLNLFNYVVLTIQSRPPLAGALSEPLVTWPYPFRYPIRNLVPAAVDPPRRSKPTGS